MLPQTSSLETCDSMLGGLPNGLGTLRSGPACASIFLTRVSVTGTFFSAVPAYRLAPSFTVYLLRGEIERLYIIFA